MGSGAVVEGVLTVDLGVNLPVGLTIALKMELAVVLGAHDSS